VTAQTEQVERDLRRLYAEAASAPAVIDGATAAALIVCGRARRWRTRVMAASVAAVAVVAAASVYGVMTTVSGTTDEPAKSPATTAPRSYDDFAGVPGTYQMLVGYGASGVAIHADLTFYDFWQSDNYPVLSDTDARHGGLAVFQPTALAGGAACLDDEEDTNVGKTPEKLAQQLAQLPRSEVVQPPTPVQAFGGQAVHLRLQVDNNCNEGAYRVADTLQGSQNISYSETPQKVVIDFWVLDVAGAPIVIDSWHEKGASVELMDQVARTEGSIKLVTEKP
jgi:hypothetical protein